MVNSLELMCVFKKSKLGEKSDKGVWEDFFFFLLERPSQGKQMNK